MIEMQRFGDLALVRVRAGKANAMTVRLLERLAAVVDDVRDARAIAITGDGPWFSGGLALPELIDFDRTGIAALFDLLEHAMIRILTAPFATVAAINGHAIAGGCVLALMCDARVMATGDARIGLNEVQLAIGLPAFVVEPLRARVSPAALAPIALEGRLFTPDEALRNQLVDELVEPPHVVERALAIAAARAAAPLAYAQIKASLLAPTLASWRARRDADREAWLDTWFSSDGQRVLRATADRLTKRA